MDFYSGLIYARHMKKKPSKKRTSKSRAIRMRHDDNWKARVEWLLDSKLTRQDIADHIGEPKQLIIDIGIGRSLRPRGMAAVKLFLLSEKYRPRV